MGLPSTPTLSRLPSLRSFLLATFWKVGISNKLLRELLNNSDCEYISHSYCMLVQCVKCSHIGSIVAGQSGNDFCSCKRQMFVQHVQHILFRPVWISRTQQRGDLICVDIPLIFNLF